MRPQARNLPFLGFTGQVSCTLGEWNIVVRGCICSSNGSSRHAHLVVAEVAPDNWFNDDLPLCDNPPTPMLLLNINKLVTIRTNEAHITRIKKGYKTGKTPFLLESSIRARYGQAISPGGDQWYSHRPPSMADIYTGFACTAAQKASQECCVKRLSSGALCVALRSFVLPGSLSPPPTPLFDANHHLQERNHWLES
ncbi:hypothetical protein PYCCODRAFT_1429048 [Trametes coccinea BRFM310]|uniref:Uncharacterized protein n=1 Tax=Trametes coccinea (strain BRFM310) TaxID=1353009 RepID=A0A1Y2I5X0_TRAC3|nr:hypothetical protein PYCCODRAFT_1429048 [Trametes coccinea BRFM310]